jgi:hypothetical protein
VVANAVTRLAFDEAVTASLDRLSVGAIRGVRLGRDVQWDLPGRDIEALRRWGLPVVPDPRPQLRVQFAADVQDGDQPAITGPDLSAYGLGTYWNQEIGAVAGDGTVIALRSGGDSGPAFLNSSVTVFLEIIWRWAWAMEALRWLHGEDDIESFGYLEEFEQLVHRLDPVTDTDPRFGFWNGILRNP